MIQCDFIWSKEYFDSAIYRGQTIQFLYVLGFFQWTKHVNMSEVYGKLPNHSKIAPGGLWRRVCKSVFFSQNGIWIFKKSVKIQKNCKNSKKNKNEAGAMYCLIYIFSDFIVDVLIFKQIFFWILPNSKKVRETHPPSMGLPWKI